MVLVAHIAAQVVQALNVIKHLPKIFTEYSGIVVDVAGEVENLSVPN